MEMVREYVTLGFKEVPSIQKDDVEIIVSRYLAGESMETIAREEAIRIKREGRIAPELPSVNKQMEEPVESEEVSATPLDTYLEKMIELKGEKIEKLDNKLLRLEEIREKVVYAIWISFAIMIVGNIVSLFVYWMHDWMPKGLGGLTYSIPVFISSIILIAIVSKIIDVKKELEGAIASHDSYVRIRYSGPETGEERP